MARLLDGTYYDAAYYYEPPEGGYIPPTFQGTDTTTFYPGQGGYIASTNRFPFEYELLKKLRVTLDALPGEEFLTRDGRIQFVLQNGRKILEDGEPVVEFVHWTEEQEDVINAVWHLIDDRCKVR